MLKKIMSLAVSALILCGFTSCSLIECDIIEKNYSVEVPPRMMFLGDSIAAGYGLNGYTSNDNYSCPDSYANILKERYTSELSEICGHEMQNFAVSGYTSADMLKLLNSGKLDSALAETDAVVVSIGGNDLLGILFELLDTLGITAENQSLDTSDIDFFKAASSLLTIDEEIDAALTYFEANLKDISIILNEKTKGAIYIQTLYNPLEAFTSFPIAVDFSNEKLNKFNEIIKNNAADSYNVIDVAAAFEGRCDELTRIARLDIHPNEEGHKVIAETVDSAFRAVGFTCTVTEYGEPHLTLSAIFLILGGFCAMIIVVIIIIPKLFKKYE